MVLSGPTPGATEFNPPATNPCQHQISNVQCRHRIIRWIGKRGKINHRGLSRKLRPPVSLRRDVFEAERLPPHRPDSRIDSERWTSVQRVGETLTVANPPFRRSTSLGSRWSPAFRLRLDAQRSLKAGLQRAVRRASEAEFRGDAAPSGQSRRTLRVRWIDARPAEQPPQTERTASAWRTISP